MKPWEERLKDYCEGFAAELGVPFTYNPKLMLQYVGNISISPYMAFDHDPIADAQQFKTEKPDV